MTYEFFDYNKVLQGFRFDEPTERIVESFGHNLVRWRPKKLPDVEKIIGIPSNVSGDTPLNVLCSIGDAMLEDLFSEIAQNTGSMLEIMHSDGDVFHRNTLYEFGLYGKDVRIQDLNGASTIFRRILTLGDPINESIAAVHRVGRFTPSRSGEKEKLQPLVSVPLRYAMLTTQDSFSKAIRREYGRFIKDVLSFQDALFFVCSYTSEDIKNLAEKALPFYNTDNMKDVLVTTREESSLRRMCNRHGLGENAYSMLTRRLLTLKNMYSSMIASFDESQGLLSPNMDRYKMMIEKILEGGSSYFDNSFIQRIKYIAKKLSEHGFSPEDISSSLERLLDFRSYDTDARKIVYSDIFPFNTPIAYMDLACRIMPWYLDTYKGNTADYFSAGLKIVNGNIQRIVRGEDDMTRVYRKLPGSYGAGKRS